MDAPARERARARDGAARRDRRRRGRAALTSPWSISPRGVCSASRPWRAGTVRTAGWVVAGRVRAAGRGDRSDLAAHRVRCSTQACAAAVGLARGASSRSSFNISAVQLRERGRLAALWWPQHSRRPGLPARRLQLELTEGALTGDMAVPREVLAELKATGLRLALDDFGTGHSGLRELQALPFDTLKLDRSFVRAASDEDAAARRIVAAVVGLGQSLGLPVVAEGVEGEHDAQMLRVLGCDAAQGWLFGRPKPASDAHPGGGGSI